MPVPSVKNEIIQALDRLDPEQLEEVLMFARQLSRPQGETLESLKEIIGLLPNEALDEIEAAIEDGCEKIDYDEW